MTHQLPPDFHDPAFTPGKQHFVALLALLGGEDEKRAEQAERALARAGLPAAERALVELAAATRPARARLVRLLGRIAGAADSDALRDALIGLTTDADPKARRNALIALGKIGGPGAEDALIAAWPKADVPHRRSICEALGKIGGPRSRELLEDVGSDDPELLRLRQRALLMLERTLARGQSHEPIALDRPLGKKFEVVLRCRAGLASVLLDEINERGLGSPRAASDCEVRLDWSGPLDPLASLRVALDYGFALPVRGDPTDDDALLAALDGADARALVSSLSRGPQRFRLAFAQGGHRRAQVWRIAEALARRQSPFRNDPTEAPWEALVDEVCPRVLWFPRGAPDVRFAYRKRDVPAASHPTVAAALARLAGARADDVVWDPFVGSGLELCERARLGPYRELLGSDTDPRALDAARENLTSAGAERFRLGLGDVRSYAPSGITLVVTNPPMGRRVARDGSLAPLMDATIDAVARALHFDGRLVWLSPHPERTAARLESKGFEVERLSSVDLGGFDAELQIAHRAQPAR